ncbi:MAG: hypothetical protein K0M45_00215 [Candidatus Paracaedibacteraceae bacterium]|nr:hypothetical protein [Candidatus Paracaedibacteraceae bacterium]
MISVDISEKLDPFGYKCKFNLNGLVVYGENIKEVSKLTDDLYKFLEFKGWSPDREAFTDYLVDKVGWPAGEWHNEPNCILWIDRGTGLKCVIFRHYYYGTLSGYIYAPLSALPESEDYNDLDLEVHGGVTYGEVYQDSYIIGFDCAHLNDFCPGISKLIIQERQYRNVDFVRSQCESLARQIKEKFIKK